ncbi:hypothetical protein [Maribacter sp. ACAM166]|uniref:hypothetical protein n=1 Tax=Maribacter sp. ACAM166 TaxID=2508996 RepID=UPI0010FE4981|nr:hypothetical protein [Maribacter sp. ACAM166]TLP80224.1 hypothetical protein ES765_08495 [Maribacter sp. ACAM166]
MKIIKTLFTITTILLLSAQTFLVAQTSKSSDYIVLNFGDTLYGNVTHIDQRGVNPKLYKKIRLTNSDNKQKKYKRKDVSAFRVNNTSYEGFWLSQSSQKIVFLNPKYDINPQSGEKYFLKVLSKGKLSHYALEWWQQGDSSVWRMDLFKKEEDQFFIRATQGILGLKRKVLVKYFSNCLDLKEQIKQKQLSKVSQVVDFYKNNCIN